MSTGTNLIADIEALLAAAKSCDVEQMDELTRLDLLGKVENIHTQLDDPKLAMYRQLTNVREVE